jgi:hypothetical protein
MRIDLPPCSFENCRFCFNGKCLKEHLYENCGVTTLKSELIKTRKELVSLRSENERLKEMTGG